ncbi:MAG: ABC transporter ATP-binding protein [Clostridiaceae bacterium]|jgi:ATP-binding cassette subfamily B multidrug efflux pump|nr:ABC transporter ATP-binding protein [Clostridiaceae bacterium]HZJ91399.1 ABC transporter ATP-binding protein [Oscillospiraceae bacterium]
MREYRTIFPFVRENKWRYIFGIIALLFVDAANLLVPQVLKKFADWAQFGELTLERTGQAALAILFLGLIVAAGRYFWRVYIFGTARRLEYWLRDKLFKKYLSLDDSFFNKHRTGDLMAHVTNDVLMVRNSMGGGIIMIVDAVFMTLFTVFMMIYTVGFQTAMVALLALPFLTVVVFSMSKPLQRRSRAVQDTFSELTTEVQENVSGINSIKAFGIEENRSESFGEINKDYQTKNMDMLRMSALFDPLIQFISGIALVIFILYGIRRMLIGSLSLGDFVAVLNYVRMMVWPLIAIGMVVNSFQRGIAAMGRINEIFTAEAKVKEAVSAVKIDESEDEGPVRIEFRDVYYRYADNLPWVLEGVSFTLENNESLAILGRTGTGKSTILKLLLRRYDVCSGQILLNGVDVRDVSYEELYSKIAFVEQESFMFSRTIAGNIAFSGDDDYDPEKVRKAAEFSQLAHDIEAMPDKYKTWVGERGVTLSGGQKQRLAIARAYYQDARVLVLDDSLSAVDTNTEKDILNHLEELECGLIVVSQRVSTVQRSDQILVLEDGIISQRGSHAELLQDKDGFYARLYQRQLLESELREDREEVQDGSD